MHGRPMFYDEFYSLKDGPISSASLNGINGVTDAGFFDKYVARNGNIVVAVKTLVRDDLNEVSNAEIRIVEDLWRRFSHMTSAQIRKWTHDNCPEYTEVTRGRLPISYLDVFKALGDSDPEGSAAQVAAFRQAESILG